MSERQVQLKEELKKLLLSKNGVMPYEELETKATGFASYFFSELDSHDVRAVIDSLTQEHTVTLSFGGAIVDPATFQPWLDARKDHNETPRWDAYSQLLVSRDWHVNVIEALDQQTDDIVQLLGDPAREGDWARRGLLLGEVQSGKTATYLGVLNKALDYGYRLVIVIGGHTNELRRQTQARFDSDLLGFESEYLGDNIAGNKRPSIGVGVINSNLKANVMTTVLEDFSQKSRRAGVTWVTSDIPTVFVIKKNAALISNVAEYIRMQTRDGRLDTPMIVIDDEADWGTPNTKTETDPTRVNKEIRKLLDVSRKSSYLGITATPFANIFIDDQAQFSQAMAGLSDIESIDDLFPSDYIRVMSSPTHYLGINEYFGGAHHLRVETGVEDCVALLPIKHKKDHIFGQLPESMKEAIHEFFVGTAVRRVRDGRVKPASMMVNVSRFNDIQKQVSELLNEYVQDLSSAIMSSFARPNSTPSILLRTWQRSFPHVTDVTWEEVTTTLVDIALDFKVELVNRNTVRDRARRRKVLTADQRRNEDAQPTIFVGGDVLSRGLTLEGLQVSYFVREPRTMDTLMQMGRWFGYRPAFGDLVRVWIPESTRDDLEYSAEVTSELRELLLEMKALELTPRDFGLRVRSNLESVAIVAANKARNASLVEVGPVLWSGLLKAAIPLSAEGEVQAENRRAATKLASDLGQIRRPETNSSGSVIWRDIPVETILDFFRLFRGVDDDQWWGNGRAAVAPIAESFREVKGGDIWDVAFISGSGDDYLHRGDLKVGQSVRNKMGREGDMIKLGNRRVSTAGDLASVLRSDQRAGFKGSTGPNEKDALRVIEHPVLLVYALTVDPLSDVQPASELQKVVVAPEAPLITVAIAFPTYDPIEALAVATHAKKYLVNTVWLRNAAGYMDDGDDLLDEDPEL